MLPPGLRARLAELYPGATIENVTPLGEDESISGEVMKALGYGRPMRIELRAADREYKLVFHTLRPDDFGHDRRSDRVGNLVLAYDSFNSLPRHVRALDVGCVRDDGQLVSLGSTGEPYLLTTWAEGTLYADELRRIASTGMVSKLDIMRVDRLVQVLHQIHSKEGTHPGAYTRAIRDLLGHGEGIFGLVDSYPAGALTKRLRAIEEACLAWRWRLRERTERLRRTHGDFHPFNILCTDGDITLLDASRGSEGDPADDVACISINFLFFGVGHPNWSNGLGKLWDRFWQIYLASDRVDVLAAVAPFFAWRALVLASPIWYPNTSDADRDRILGFAERVLYAERFDPAWGAETMAHP